MSILNPQKNTIDVAKEDESTYDFVITVPMNENGDFKVRITEYRKNHEPYTREIWMRDIAYVMKQHDSKLKKANNCPPTKYDWYTHTSIIEQLADSITSFITQIHTVYNGVKNLKLSSIKWWLLDCIQRIVD